MVFQAGDPSSPARDEAFAELLRLYWYPLYAFIRRQGHNAHQAEDLLQSFLARLLENESLQQVRQGQGRFRNFLLVCLRNYMTNEAERANAQKRGGGKRTLSLDFESADSRFQFEPAHQVTAERLFERDWALELIQNTFSQLSCEWRGQGKSHQFDALSKFLVGTAEGVTYAAAGRELGMSEGAVKTAVHRLRARFRQVLCEQVSATLADDELLDDEIRRLFEALSV
jgi:RNA polymerase sigma-70 factor (ECF subfamily)